MNKTNKELNFSYQTKEKLGYYVYTLTTNVEKRETIFYVSKGKDGRVFSHFKDVDKINVKSFNKETNPW